MNRRCFVVAGAGAGAGALLGVGALAAREEVRGSRNEGVDDAEGDARVSGTSTSTFKHSVCRWPYSKLTVDELARMARDLGLDSVELLEPDEWPIARRHGLTCAVGYATVPDPRTRLTHGFNRAEHHEWLVPAYERAIPLAAAAGVPNLICFSGNRDGSDDYAGLTTCARGLAKLLPLAERHGVTLVMELLNSRIDHPGYQCDRTAWGVALARFMGSESLKLLYDIYHMQIMEGDVIRTIRDNHEYIGHYHTAGVPGRNEIDASQELNYPAIMRAIADTGFTGYVAQEFIPTRDPRQSLREAVELCRV